MFQYGLRCSMCYQPHNNETINGSCSNFKKEAIWNKTKTEDFLDDLIYITFRITRKNEDFE